MTHMEFALLTLSLGTLLSSDLKAEEASDKPKTEAEVAAEEDEKEVATSGLAFKPVVLEGRLSLNPIQEGETPDTPVGTFSTKRGTFQVKFAPESQTLRRTLMSKNNKQVRLSGKLRNERKYFVVMSDMTQNSVPPPVPIVTPGGL